MVILYLLILNNSNRPFFYSNTLITIRKWHNANHGPHSKTNSSDSKYNKTTSSPTKTSSNGVTLQTTSTKPFLNPKEAVNSAGNDGTINSILQLYMLNGPLKRKINSLISIKSWATSGHKFPPIWKAELITMWKTIFTQLYVSLSENWTHSFHSIEWI